MPPCLGARGGRSLSGRHLATSGRPTPERFPAGQRRDKLSESAPPHPRGPPMKFAEMTAPLLRQVPRDRALVVLPIAACEPHSRHLPVITDTVLVTAVADGVEANLPDAVLQLPTLWLGASHHHLRFGGTLSVPVDAHVDLLAGIV